MNIVNIVTNIEAENLTDKVLQERLEVAKLKFTTYINSVELLEIDDDYLDLLGETARAYRMVIKRREANEK